MKPEIKQQWVAALRSGEYAQGRDRLRTEDGGFCCLGVLCDLHAKANAGAWDDVGSEAAYLGRTTDLPPEVQAWAGLDHEEGGKVSVGDDGKQWLAVHNDGHIVQKRTFLEIADAIEAQL